MRAHSRMNLWRKSGRDGRYTRVSEQAATSCISSAATTPGRAVPLIRSANQLKKGAISSQRHQHRTHQHLTMTTMRLYHLQQPPHLQQFVQGPYRALELALIVGHQAGRHFLASATIKATTTMKKKNRFPKRYALKIMSLQRLMKLSQFMEG